MSKTQQELKELRQKIGVLDALIHDIYSTLTEQLDKDMARAMSAERTHDIKLSGINVRTATDAQRLYHFVAAEVAERERKEKKPEYRYLKFGCLYNAAELTKEEAMAMFDECEGAHPELILLEEILNCPKCGADMKIYWIQRQPRAGYKTDIELQSFKCTNPNCQYQENKRREVPPLR